MRFLLAVAVFLPEREYSSTMSLGRNTGGQAQMGLTTDILIMHNMVPVTWEINTVRIHEIREFLVFYLFFLARIPRWRMDKRNSRVNA